MNGQNWLTQAANVAITKSIIIICSPKIIYFFTAYFAKDEVYKDKASDTMAGKEVYNYTAYHQNVHFFFLLGEGVKVSNCLKPKLLLNKQETIVTTVLISNPLTIN